MSYYPRKGSSSSIASTKSALSTVISSKNNCLYKKEILSSLQKLPSKINKDGVVKTYISKNNNLTSEKKEKPVMITPSKNNIINKPFSVNSKNIKNLIFTQNKNNYNNDSKSKIEDITFNLEDLFNNIVNNFSNGNNCVNECKDFVELLNENLDFILDKIEANEYMPLISNCVNAIFISIILICNLSDNGKYNLFKFDTNKIFDNCKNLCECIFERIKNKNNINLKDKSNSMTNFYKNITNSLNIIVSKYNQFIPSISKEFESLMKNFRRINFTELYNFYVDFIKNPKKIKEFQLDLNEKKNNKVFQSYKLFNKNRNNNNQKESRGLSMDYINKNINKSNNQLPLNSSNSYKAILSDNINNINDINNINAFSSNGIIFPYKKIRNESQGYHRKNFNYINYNNFNPTVQYSFNGKIYNKFQGNSPDNSNVNIIISEINPNEKYYNENNTFNPNNNYIQINRSNQPMSPQINDDIFSERINKSKSINYYGHSTPESNQMSISQRNTPNNYIKSNTFDVKSYNKNYRNKTLSLPLIPFSPEKIYTLLIHLDDTIIHIPNKTNNIFIRNFLIDFINIINPYYEIISFTNGNENYSEQIINLIETKDKYFDYCLHKDNATYLNEEYFKDINKLGRNIKKTIIIDEVNNNLGINNDNTIYIKPFILNNQNDIINKNNDCILKNLSNVLIDIAKEEPDDVRKYLRMNKREIMNQTC